MSLGILPLKTTLYFQINFMCSCGSYPKAENCLRWYQIWASLFTWSLWEEDTCVLLGKIQTLFVLPSSQCFRISEAISQGKGMSASDSSGMESLHELLEGYPPMQEYWVTCVIVEKDICFENWTCFPRACSSLDSHFHFAFTLGGGWTSGAARPRRWSWEEGELPGLQSAGSKLRLTITFFAFLHLYVFCFTSVGSSA